MVAAVKPITNMNVQRPKHIGPQEAWALVESGANPFFLDTRNAKHWGQSKEKIPGAVRIWREELADRVDEVPADRPVITYCA